MEHPFHPFHELFQVLGLPATDADIRAFLQAHAPLPQGVALPDAPFWAPAQVAFLREAVEEDGDWAEVVDQSNAALRQG
jgi:hypothetical protein